MKRCLVIVMLPLALLAPAGGAASAAPPSFTVTHRITIGGEGGWDVLPMDTAAQQLVFSSKGEGTLTVIHEDSPDRYSVVENAPTQAGGRTLALDESTGTVYIPTAEFGTAPEPTTERPHPRPSIVPGTFTILVVSR